MLYITRYQSEGVCTQEVADAIERGKSAGPVVVLLPSRTQVVNLQRFLAERHASEGDPGRTLALGVYVDTLSGWLDERWALLGDGRQPMGDIQRLLLVTKLVQQRAEANGPASLGSVKTISNLVKQALPWLDEHAQACQGLTPRELDVVKMAQEYEQEATSQGMVEQSRMLQMLPQMLEDMGFSGTVVLAGFASLTYGQRFAVMGMARSCTVEVMVPAGAGAGFRQADALASQLEASAQEAGLPCECVFGQGASVQGAAPQPARDAELQQLVEKLFHEQSAEPIARISPTDGAVELLMPAGPLAEPRAVAAKIEELAASGSRDVVVVAPRVRDAWQTLAPWLGGAGMQVQASYRISPVQSEAGKAFFALAQTVADLSIAQEEVDAQASGDIRLQANAVATSALRARDASMGSMEWWPPRQAVDFLLSSISGVAPQTAWSLDRRWRGTRALAPGKVLNTLCSEQATSKTCALAASALRKGQLARAAALLKAPCEEALEHALADWGMRSNPESASPEDGVGGNEGTNGAGEPALADSFQGENIPDENPQADIVAWKERVAVLAAIEEAARQVAALRGYEDGPYVSGGEAVDPAEVAARVDAVMLAASALSAPVRPVLPAAQEGSSGRAGSEQEPASQGAAAKEPALQGAAAPAGTACVRIVSPYEAARMEPCSCDALVYTGLDLVHAPVGSRASAAALLLDKLGIEPRVAAIDPVRWAFLCCVRLPRTRLVVEHCAHGPRASDAYPAAMLAELLACYPLLVDEKGKPKGSVLLPESHAPETALKQDVLPAYAALAEANDEARDGVSLPELLLLASRRHADYGDEDDVAGREVAQDGAQGGEASPLMPAASTPVVLSATQIETYLHCPQQWLAKKRLGLSKPDAEFDPLAEGSFAHAVLEKVFNHCKENPGAILLEVFEQKFEEAFAQQFFYDPQVEGSGVLVPHCIRDDTAFAQLHDNLRATLEFSQERFAGFKPLACELGFGHGHMKGYEHEPTVLFDGIALCGSIDRVDVNENGDVLVVDYKRSKKLAKYSLAFVEEDAAAQGGEAQGSEAQGGEAQGEAAQAGDDQFALPFHIQALLYAWVLKTYAKDFGLPDDLNVVGAVYLGTGETRSMFGAVDKAHLDEVFGDLDYRGAPKRGDVVVQLQPGCSGVRDFNEYLDLFEQALAPHLKRLVDDHDVDPRPWGNEKETDLCKYCPVAGCPARRAE